MSRRKASLFSLLLDRKKRKKDPARRFFSFNFVVILKFFYNVYKKNFYYNQIKLKIQARAGLRAADRARGEQCESDVHLQHQMTHESLQVGHMVRAEE